jgi:N-acetylglucosamine-6-phosphate deacetylase
VGVPARAQIDVDYAAPPPVTEAELFGKVVVVVRGRVEATRMEANPGPTMSVYTVRILELLKDDGRHSVGGVIDVHRHGGFDAKTMDREFSPSCSSWSPPTTNHQPPTSTQPA